MIGRRLASLVALVCLVMATRAAALPGDVWLVAIGNNRGDAQDVELLYAERDALELARVLWADGGVSPQRTILLLGEDATTVRREVLKVNARLRAATGPATLVVFYSGHADADALHLDGAALPLDELRAMVESSSAQVRLLVVDACRSGQVTRVKGTDPAESFELSVEDRLNAEGLAIITSSAAGETSQESDRLRASFFSHHLTAGLRGAADRNGDGQVTLGEAYGYTYLQTVRSSGRTMSLQHPTYEYDVKGKGELVVTTPGRNRGATATVQLRGPGVYVVLERSADGPVVAEVAPARAGATLSLPPGTYVIVERRPTELRRYPMTLQPGARVDLTVAPFDAVAYDRLVRARGADEGDVSWSHGLTLISGARGELVAGEGVAPQLVLGYSLDTPWFSLGVRLRGATTDAGGVLPRRHHELGLGLALQRFIDLDILSLSFGVLFEGVYHAQTFDSDDAPTRHAAGFAFTGLFSLERHLGVGLGLRLEGGPVVNVFDRATTTGGEAIGEEEESPLTWWVAAGLVWRL